MLRNLLVRIGPRQYMRDLPVYKVIGGCEVEVSVGGLSRIPLHAVLRCNLAERGARDVGALGIARSPISVQCI